MEFDERWGTIQNRVALACHESGRPPDSVTVIAVTKTVGLPLISAAYECGVRHFGESRLQEALPKIANMPSDCVWHFIGKLQSNKAKLISQAFDAVHTIESDHQVKELVKAGRTIDGFIEVNVAEESQKAGVFAERLDETVQMLSSFSQVRFRGLMTIGPLTPDPEQSRAVFRKLAELAKTVGTTGLSMGMSADYDVAIQEGATHVRVGSALFGERT